MDRRTAIQKLVRQREDAFFAAHPAERAYLRPVIPGEQLPAGVDIDDDDNQWVLVRRDDFGTWRGFRMKRATMNPDGTTAHIDLDGFAAVDAVVDPSLL